MARKKAKKPASKTAKKSAKKPVAKKPTAKTPTKQPAKKPAKQPAAKQKKPAKQQPAKTAASTPTKSSSAAAHAELENFLRDWNDYPVTAVRFATCTCGNAVFRVEVDDACGAKRTCVACKREHLIGDSAEYWEDAEPDECACPCGKEAFQLAAGFAFYAESTDVRWIYIALRCEACAQVGVYVDWKIDYAPSRQLLDQV